MIHINARKRVKAAALAVVLLVTMGPIDVRPVTFRGVETLVADKTATLNSATGVGTSPAGTMLDVKGTGTLQIWRNSGGTNMASMSDTGALSPSPAAASAGTVLFFNGACPYGWTEYAAAQGRYIVGMPSGGTLTATVGAALTDTQNRPVGLHSHPIADVLHNHTGVARLQHTNHSGGAALGSIRASQADVTSLSYTGITATDNTTCTDCTTAGTNAPYIQLRVCKKD